MYAKMHLSRPEAKAATYTEPKESSVAIYMGIRLHNKIMQFI